MKRKSFTLFLCAVILCGAVCLTSCSQKSATAQSVLYAMMTAEIGLPSGNVYLSDAPEGDNGYTSDSLLAALYGDGSAPVESGEWLEFAIFLSGAKHPCEFGVFLCESAQSASDTGKMLCRRLDILKTAWSGTEYSSYVDNASVCVSGNFCILIISSDASSARKAAMTLIG